ncbi:MAG: hypothetical protein ACT4QC_18210 [Planctomycetaceae bacterium]
MPDLEIIDPAGPQQPEERLGDRCRSLLSKGLYLNAGLPEGEHVTGDGHFWCAHTQRIFGPDDGLVGNEECRRVGRKCYIA